MTDRAVSTVVGLLAVVAVTAALSAGIGLTLQGATEERLDGDPPKARLELSVTADGRVTLAHVGGDRLDVRKLRVRIAVDGDPLAHQPPVPFFSARGFHSGPTGPFNSADDPRWSAGETASVRVASTNDPTIGEGSTVTVRVYAGDRPVFEGTATAG